MTREAIKSTGWGTLVTLTVALLIVIGSRNLSHFDAAIGLGNGAVFKLVPEYFPQSVGAVTGLVGAAGGLGGFFPPSVLGMVRQATGTFTPCFVFLALFAIICFVVVFKSGSKPNPKTHLISHGAAA